MKNSGELRVADSRWYVLEKAKTGAESPID